MSDQSIALVFVRMLASIKKSQDKNHVLRGQDRENRAVAAQNIANLMEDVSQAYAEAMIDLAGQCKSLTKFGDLSEIETFRAAVSEDAKTYLIDAIREDCQEQA